jgi:transmembrane sensor
MKAPDISPLLLEKYLLDQCTEEEKALVEAWYASLKGETRYLDHLPDAEAQEIHDDTFRNINAELKPASEEPARMLHWRWITGLAASVLLVLGLYFINPFKKTPQLTVTEQLGEKGADDLTRFANEGHRIIIHHLPDGSSVSMHPDAVITYPKNFDDDKRLVAFTGEGFFDITKDKTRPFMIQSGEMVIRVLGTSFNVKAPVAQKVFQVDVVTGTVEVTTPGTEKKPQQVILKPKQQALFEIASGRLISQHIPDQARKEIYEPVSIVFEETPLNNAIQQLEKRFNVSISLSNPEISRCSVTANFESQPLAGILEMLCTTLEASYTISGKSILISGTPCE